MQVAEIWRYPVKSMGGERLDSALVTVFAATTLAAGLAVLRTGVMIATARWRADEPGLIAAITPTR